LHHNNFYHSDLNLLSLNDSNPTLSLGDKFKNYALYTLQIIERLLLFSSFLHSEPIMGKCGTF